LRVDESCWVKLHQVRIDDCPTSFYAHSEAVSICLHTVATMPYRKRVEIKNE
jgi:hypothetical protein